VRAAVLLVGGAALLAGCGGSKKQAQSPATTASKVVGGCTVVSQPAPGERHEAKAFEPLDASETYDVVLRTNCGSFTIRLDVRTSPHVTASFAYLAGKGYFDHTVFHRIVPGFVIQGGDPTASGSGGPGYETVDRPPRSTRYTFGLVAMAKTQTEAPGTAGSQFFVVTGKDAGLPPDYAVLGRVTKGLDVVRRIGRLGDPQTEQPTRIVEIEKATLRVS
jgi:cyclophilin family peptidyl-prolyl cis-trans isomerase